MTVRAVRDLLNCDPFVPFKFVMSGGERHEVRRPELVFLTRSEIIVGVDVAKDGIPNSFRICSLDQISTMETMSSDAS